MNMLSQVEVNVGSEITRAVRGRSSWEIKILKELIIANYMIEKEEM